MTQFPRHPTPLWVFAYGSLIWNPGFAFVERRHARLFGYHRSLCLYSHVHRGTPERPGLVLALDRGGSCRGIAYRIEDNQQEQTLAYLRARELVTSAYHEASLEISLTPDETSTSAATHGHAVTYVMDRNHPQYAGRLPPQRQLELVRQGIGKSGINADYVTATSQHLRALGIHDSRLEWLERHLLSD